MLLGSREVPQVMMDIIKRTLTPFVWLIYDVTENTQVYYFSFQADYSSDLSLLERRLLQTCKDCDRLCSFELKRNIYDGPAEENLRFRVYCTRTDDRHLALKLVESMKHRIDRRVSVFLLVHEGENSMLNENSRIGSLLCYGIELTRSSAKEIFLGDSYENYSTHSIQQSWIGPHQKIVFPRRVNRDHSGYLIIDVPMGVKIISACKALDKERHLRLRPIDYYENGSYKIRSRAFVEANISVSRIFVRVPVSAWRDLSGGHVFLSKSSYLCNCVHCGPEVLFCAPFDIRGVQQTDQAEGLTMLPIGGRWLALAMLCNIGNTKEAATLSTMAQRYCDFDDGEAKDQEINLMKGQHNGPPTFDGVINRTVTVEDRSLCEELRLHLDLAADQPLKFNPHLLSLIRSIFRDWYVIGAKTSLYNVVEKEFDNNELSRFARDALAAADTDDLAVDSRAGQNVDCHDKKAAWKPSFMSRSGAQDSHATALSALKTSNQPPSVKIFPLPRSCQTAPIGSSDSSKEVATGKFHVSEICDQDSDDDSVSHDGDSDAEGDVDAEVSVPEHSQDVGEFESIEVQSGLEDFGLISLEKCDDETREQVSQTEEFDMNTTDSVSTYAEQIMKIAPKSSADGSAIFSAVLDSLSTAPFEIDETSCKVADVSESIRLQELTERVNESKSKVSTFDSAAAAAAVTDGQFSFLPDKLIQHFASVLLESAYSVNDTENELGGGQACRSCGRRFKSKAKRLEHEQTEHKFFCYECFSPYYAGGPFKMHLAKAHGITADEIVTNTLDLYKFEVYCRLCRNGCSCVDDEEAEITYFDPFQYRKHVCDKHSIQINDIVEIKSYYVDVWWVTADDADSENDL
jgi:hypothetical protein